MEDKKKAYALGVLFVHGIGEQPRGDTLLAFGEPLIRTLDRWVDGRKIGRTRVVDSKLSDTQLDTGEPAHSVLEIALHNRPIQTWLLAESWWADEFRRPPFMKLAGWLLTIGPWAIISHASRWLRGAPRVQQPYQLLKIVLAVPLSLLLQILVGLLALLAWLPIPVLRRTVSGFLLRVTGTLGDSYVLLESPQQKAAAIGALRRHIEWLANDCENVIVIAHSQGAAIARLTLAEHRDLPVSLLVTFGSGVAKLTELESLSTGRLARVVRTMLAVSLVAIALFPRARALVTDDDVQSFVWTMYVFMPLTIVVTAITLVWKEIKDWPKRAAELSLTPLEWIDYWATFDPVPNGPLAPDDTVAKLTQVKLTNRISWLTDHSAYWANRDEFVLPLLRELDRRASTGVLTGEPAPAIAGIPARRTRVAVLAGARVVIGLLATPIALFALRDQLTAFGRDTVLQSLDARPFTRPISELLTGVGSFVAPAIGLLLGRESAALDGVGHLGVGALVLLALMAAWYRFCVLPMWESWDAQCFDWLCRPTSIPPHRADRLLRPVLLAAVAIVPLALAVRSLFQPDVGRLLDEGINTLIATPVLIMASVLLIAIVILIGQAPLAVVRWIRSRRGKPQTADEDQPV
jgi:pimeloyl-ACP methyl ester carboxylesterase